MGVMDDEWFIQIAYEAELSTAESPELLALARELVHEDPETRAAALHELREIIYERGECSPRRMDDAFLLRFLRARWFVVPRAHALVRHIQLVRYSRFLEQYPYLYKGVDLFGLCKTKGAYEGTMLDRPDVGRVGILRFGTWDPNEFPNEDLVRTGLAIVEIAFRQPKLQVLGGVLIIDLEGISMRHVATLTPTVVYQIVCLVGVGLAQMACPIRWKSYHFINYSWILNTVFYLFQRYMGPGARKRTFFHGNDVKSLQQHIDPECLPTRYGGTLTAYHNNFGFWLKKIQQYRDKQFDREMREFGYTIKE